MTAILLNAIKINLLLGMLPDSLDLLIFGVVMIFSAAGLRRILSRNDKRRRVEKFERTPEKTNS